jgi:hypothetical protein
VAESSVMFTGTGVKPLGWKVVMAGRSSQVVIVPFGGLGIANTRAPSEVLGSLLLAKRLAPISRNVSLWPSLGKSSKVEVASVR